MSAQFTEDQVTRYARHIILPQIGGAGQRKLLEAKVLAIGAGGLGSPIAMYLAAAGVGTLGIVDFDKVDLTNLQRQIVHTTADVGRPKVESAADHLRAINPTIEIVPHDTILSSANAFEITKARAGRGARLGLGHSLFQVAARLQLDVRLEFVGDFALDGHGPDEPPKAACAG